MAPSSSFVPIVVFLGLVLVLVSVIKPRSEARPRAFFVFGDFLVHQLLDNLIPFASKWAENKFNIIKGTQTYIVWLCLMIMQPFSSRHIDYDSM